MHWDEAHTKRGDRGIWLHDWLERRKFTYYRAKRRFSPVVSVACLPKISFDRITRYYFCLPSRCGLVIFFRVRAVMEHWTPCCSCRKIEPIIRLHRRVSLCGRLNSSGNVCENNGFGDQPYLEIVLEIISREFVRVHKTELVGTIAERFLRADVSGR